MAKTKNIAETKEHILDIVMISSDIWITKLKSCVNNFERFLIRRNMIILSVKLASDSEDH